MGGGLGAHPVVAEQGRPSQPRHAEGTLKTRVPPSCEYRGGNREAAPRALLLRPRGGGGPSRRYEIGHGDLLVMGGSCQRTWEHAVPKTARWVGPRLSVQFRPRGVRLSPETGALSTLPAADYEATMDLSPTEE
jgi:hypothetical protein